MVDNTTKYDSVFGHCGYPKIYRLEKNGLYLLRRPESMTDEPERHQKKDLISFNDEHYVLTKGKKYETFKSVVSLFTGMCVNGKDVKLLEFLMDEDEIKQLKKEYQRLLDNDNTTIGRDAIVWQ
jgi:hypothetical protein